MLRPAASGGAAAPGAAGAAGGGKATMSPEEHKALVRRWFAETDKGNLAIIDELLPPEYLDHNPPIPGLPPGREGIRQANLLLRAAFPDVVHIIDDQVAEGDKVMTRVTTRATFLGAFLGYPPTGKVIEVRGISVHRVAGGRLVEHWAQADMAGFMEQLGAPAGAAEGGDAAAGPPGAPPD
jgi:predicted ester cyclase